MRFRPISIVLILAVIFSSVATVEAQCRRFRSRRPDSRSREPRSRDPRSRANANHERAKIQAERSYQQGKYERAIDLTTNVLLENPRDHVAYYLRASARVEDGIRKGDTALIRQGISDARESIRLDNNRTGMYYLPYLYGMKNLAVMENRKQHAEIAVTVAGQALSIGGLSGEDRANLLYQRAAPAVGSASATVEP